MNYSQLTDLYEKKVLPALFERLDWGFPEFQWTRTTCGWTGVRKRENGYTDSTVSTTIVCDQPWGYVDQNGVAVSWRSHVSHLHGVDGSGFVAAVRKLAELAGVTDSTLHGLASISSLDEQQAERNERRRELIESFVACCQARLRGASGNQMRLVLQHEYGISPHSIGQLPVGMFTSPQDIGQCLASRGFTCEELDQSYLVCDPRLTGRLVVPWRDRWGRLCTVVAQDLSAQEPYPSHTLYQKGGSKTEAFGLDVALRTGSGGHEHLILVDSILDVVFFQSVGLRNVATVGTHDHSVTREHWEKLADHDIRAVTLATTNHEPAATRIHHALEQFNLAQKAPQVFTLSPDDFVHRYRAAEIVRRHGLDRFRALLKKRVHGYRFIALSILRKHRQSTGWTDAGMYDAINEAMKFDARVSDPDRKLELERYFWPTILESTGVRWDRLRRLPQERSSDDPEKNYDRWRTGNLRSLLCELETAVRQDDYECFGKLICAAARDFEDDGIRSCDPPAAPSGLDRFRRYRRTDDASYDTGTRHSDASGVSSGQYFRVPTNAEIRALAYELWDRDGRSTGLDQYYWYRAEQELKGAGAASTRTACWQE